MARYKFQGRARDTWGNIKEGLDIYVYVSDTNRTQDAIVYSTSASGSTPLSAAPQISTDSYGLFKFWVDDTDYTASTTKFDIVASGIEYDYLDVFNIKKHGTMGDLTADDHTRYPSLSASEVITGNWRFTQPLSGATPTSDNHLATKVYADTSAGFDPSTDRTITGNWLFTKTVSGQTPTLNNHLATKAYADASGGFDPSSDQTITGDWQYTQPVSGQTPTLDNHLSTKLYTDLLAFDPTADQTISGNWEFSQPVSGQTPTADSHLVTKAYADASGSTTSNIISAGDSYVQVTDTGTGQVLTSVDGNTSILSTPTSTQLYYSGNKTFETSNAGINVLSSGGNTAQLKYESNDIILKNTVNAGKVTLKGNTTGGSERTMIMADPDGGVNLYHSGVISFVTRTSGIGIYDQSGDDVYVLFYNSSGNAQGFIGFTNGAEFQIYDELNDNYYVKGLPNAATELYYNGTKEFETISSGVQILNGDLRVGNLGSTRGNLTLYGSLVGDTGGNATFHTADDYDGSVASYSIRAHQDDFYIGSENFFLSLTYKGDTNYWNFYNALVSIGRADNDQGILDIYGDGAASTGGGTIKLYTAADHDTTIDNYQIQVYEDDLYIGPATDTDSLIYDGDTGSWTFTPAASGSVTVDSILKLKERSSDPPQPSEGETVIWMSDGTGKGDDGDVMIAGTAGGTTTYTTLFDHSAGGAW